VRRHLRDDEGGEMSVQMKAQISQNHAQPARLCTIG
jgi:hypothetical protein